MTEPRKPGRPPEGPVRKVRMKDSLWVWAGEQAEAWRCSRAEVVRIALLDFRQRVENGEV